MIRRERRGPYKKYLSPGNDAIVPKNTIQYNNNTTDTASSSLKSRPELRPSSSQEVDLDELEQPSTSRTKPYENCTTAFGANHITPNNLVGPPEDELFQLLDEADSESGDLFDGDLSDDPSHYTSNSQHNSPQSVFSDEELLHNPDDASESDNCDGTELLDEDIPLSPELNEIVAGQCNKSKFEILLLILTYSIRHSLTTVAIIDLIKLINSVLGNNVLPQTKYWLTKIFDGGINFTYHLYCPTCMTYIGPVPNGGKTGYTVLCPSCPDHLVSYSINNDNPSVFVTISMAEQLKTLFETRKDIQMNLNYRNERVTETGKIKDILDGLAYKKLMEQGGILSDKNNFSITFNTDGAPVFKSSKCSIWPLQFFFK